MLTAASFGASGGGQRASTTLRMLQILALLVLGLFTLGANAQRSFSFMTALNETGISYIRKTGCNYPWPSDAAFCCLNSPFMYRTPVNSSVLSYIVSRKSIFCRALIRFADAPVPRDLGTDVFGRPRTSCCLPQHCSGSQLLL